MRHDVCLVWSVSTVKVPPLLGKSQLLKRIPGLSFDDPESKDFPHLLMANKLNVIFLDVYEDLPVCFPHDVIHVYKGSLSWIFACTVQVILGLMHAQTVSFCTGTGTTDMPTSISPHRFDLPPHPSWSQAKVYEMLLPIVNVLGWCESKLGSSFDTKVNVMLIFKFCNSVWSNKSNLTVIVASTPNRSN